MPTNPLSDFDLHTPSELHKKALLDEALAGAVIDLEFRLYSPTKTPATAANALGGYDREVRRAVNLVVGFGFGSGDMGLIPPSSMELTKVTDGSLGANWKMVQEWTTDFARRIRDGLAFQDDENGREDGLTYITRLGKAAAGIGAVALLLTGAVDPVVNLVIDMKSGEDQARTVLRVDECVTREFLDSVAASRLPRDVELRVVCTIRTPDGQELSVTVETEH